jgi:peptide/nickel transport system ATP-binding protein
MRKTTLGRMAVGLHELSDGKRYWKGVDIATLPPQGRRKVQLGMQMIFQDPYASLNPRKRVVDIVGEAAVLHGVTKAAQRNEFVAELVSKVGLPAAVLRRYPHQFSGGQRAVSASRARSPSTPNSWCATSPWPRWMCRSRRKSSIFSCNCGPTSV